MLSKGGQKVPVIRQSQNVGRGASTDQKPRSTKAEMINQSQLPPSIRQSLPKGPRSNYESNEVLSEHNAKSMLRAKEIQRKDSQNKQRQMSGIISMHESKINKGLNAAKK